MATVNKDFKIKSGLIVEGSSATVNGYDVLTKNPADDQHIIDLIGGEATSLNTPDTVVKRDSNGDFAAGTITADVTGDVTGTVSDISNHNTDSLTEGSTNLYFTQDRARTSLTDGSGISYSDNDGTISVNTGTNGGLGFDINDDLVVDRTQTDTWYDASGSATTAEQNAKDYADGLINDGSSSSTEVWSAYKTSTEIGLAQAAAELHADNAVAALVDSAPALLDTLNELAAAIGDDANFASTIGTSIGEKVAKSGDTMTGELVLSADPTQALAAATKQYVDAQASDAYNDAIAQADQTAQGYANTAESNANTYTDNSINALDTDDIEEGINNLYFTDGRAKDSAAALLTNATLTNIQITGTGNGGLTITAENGVADSDTDDLVEGSTNLYFTDQRAVDALEAVVPNFTAVDINSVAKQVAGSTVVPVAGIATAYSWLKADYRSAEFLVKVAYGTHTEISKVLITLDTSDNIAITEYGIVGTNGSASTVSATISGNDVQLQVTTVNNTSTVTVVGTLLA
jgi:hypothetical protein